MRHLALIAMLLAAPAAAQGEFPTVQADDLNGRSVTLPADLPGDPTVVFIAYKMNQQAAIDGWVQALGLDASQGTEFVEIPVVGVGTRLIKGFLDNGMRSGITDPDMRARTITLYEAPDFVNEPLGFAGRDTIRVLVVRPSGEVLFATSGAVTAEAAAAVRAAYNNR